MTNVGKTLLLNEHKNVSLMMESEVQFNIFLSCSLMKILYLCLKL